MKTTLSTKGPIVVPGAVRTSLGLHPGDSLDVEVESGRIIFTPNAKKKYVVRIAKDPISGLSVATAEPGAPTLTSQQVREMLCDFP